METMQKQEKEAGTSRSENKLNQPLNKGFYFEKGSTGINLSHGVWEYWLLGYLKEEAWKFL